MIHRLDPEKCAGVVIDVQEFFMKTLAADERKRLIAGTADLVSLLSYFNAPVLCTLEKPLKMKGELPPEIEKQLSRGATILEKEFFDLTREKHILRYLRTLQRKQMIVAGCETDVCVLQSCLGMLARGFEVYVVEDLLFSSTEATRLARKRMYAEGAIPLTFKTLYYELVPSVHGSKHYAEMLKRFGKMPERFREW